MKDLNRILFVATVAAGLASAGVAVAQSQLSGPNGAAMSPKQRFLRDAGPGPVLVMDTRAEATWPSVSDPGMGGSPKQQQLAAQRQPAPVAQPSETAAYRPTGSDGITASPKLRQQIEQNTVEFQVAPLR